MTALSRSRRSSTASSSKASQKPRPALHPYVPRSSQLNSTQLNTCVYLTYFEQNPLVGFFTTIKETVWPTPPKECSEFLQRLAASGRPTRDLVACVIGLAVGSSVNYAQAVAQVVDFYLGADRAQERAALIDVCKRDDAKSKELLKGYVREAMRLNPQFGGLFRVAVQDDVVPQGTGFQPLQVKKGDLLFAGFKNAHLNVSLPSPLLFPSSVSQRYS